jgi:hypothetical protein
VVLFGDITAIDPPFSIFIKVYVSTLLVYNLLPSGVLGEWKSEP